MSKRKEATATQTGLSGFFFLLGLRPILSPPSSLSRFSFHLRLRKIMSTCNSATTRRSFDTGRGIPGHWSWRRLSDVLSFRRCVSSVLYASRRLNPLGGSCLSTPSPPLSRYLTISSEEEGIRAARLFFFPTFRPASPKRQALFRLAPFLFLVSRARLQSRHSFRNKIVGLR